MNRLRSIYNLLKKVWGVLPVFGIFNSYDGKSEFKRLNVCFWEVKLDKAT